VKLGVEAALVEGRLIPGDVEIVDGLVGRHGLASRNGHGVAAPGFVDIQVNGFGGVDFLDSDTDGYRRAGEALLETGVTAYLPAFITAPEEQLHAALREVPERTNGGPHILGVHLEGPFLAEKRLGTHPPLARRDPDPALLGRLLDSGRIRMVTLAPELPGADSLIELLLRRGVTVSLGHTDATAEEANEAFDAGVRTVTHLFNAMRPFGHRDPGIAGAALARPDVVVQVILDGIHLAPETAKLVWSAAAGRVALVTDAVAGAGLDDGSYSLGGFEVKIRDGVARGPDGVLAGSSLTMIEAVRNLHELGVPLSSALDAASSVPARVVGEQSQGLVPGARADVVVVDDSLSIERVLVEGRERVVA
jgi:N-acetylglucosamine-6-phosphate deacetylase